MRFSTIMSSSTYAYLLSDARKALEGRHLLPALQSLQGLAMMLKAWKEKDEVDTLTAAYRSLLDYLAKGANDPERDKMYRGFVRRAYELGDVLERVGEQTEENSFYATALRTLKNLKGSEYQLPDMLTENESGRNIFDAVWLSGAWTLSDETAVADFMAADHVSENHKCLLLSAATLAAMRFFDIAKYRLLLDYALSPDCKLRARALTGLCFVHIVHPGRAALYPEVDARLKLMADVRSFVRELELLQMQLFLTLETKRIERSLQDEIIPRMMKRMESLRLDRSLGLDDLKAKLSEVDLNPEWEEDGTPSKLAEYMNEFVELQKRGADMYMSSFKMLKQRFPFFGVASNWFWPFTLEHPDVPQAARNHTLLRTLVNQAGLCDSDKYSFSLMVDMFPKQGGGNPLQEQMLEAMGQMSAAQPPAPEPDALTAFKDELRSYVQGFYRFCNLYIHREAFMNPFRENLFIVDYAPFDRLLLDDEFMLRMANFVFKDKSYALAQKLYIRLSPAALDAEVYQRLGYCHEQGGEYAEAVTCYEKANILKPRSVWTLRRIAACNRVLGNFHAALAAYDELAEMYTEDADIALRQAECLIRLEQYEEAFQYLFKANYLAPESVNAERALAWCSLLTGKYEQAEKYYLRVMQGKPSPTDYLNAGHAAWLLGHVADAVARYRKALPETDKENFLAEDMALLRKAGLSENELAMMTDAVCAE